LPTSASGVLARVRPLLAGGDCESASMDAERHSPFQILVSIEAVKALYGILCALLDELREIDLLFRMEADAQRPGRFNEAKMLFEPFSEDKLKESIIPSTPSGYWRCKNRGRRSRNCRNFPTQTSFAP
jgi:hypothetical protein